MPVSKPKKIVPLKKASVKPSGAKAAPVKKAVPKTAAPSKKVVAQKAAPAKAVTKPAAKVASKVAAKKSVAPKTAPAKAVASPTTKVAAKVAPKVTEIKKNDKKKIEPNKTEIKKDISKTSNIVAKLESKKVMPAANKTHKSEPKKAEPAMIDLTQPPKALVRYADSELELFKIKIVDMRKEAIEELGMLKERLDDLTNYDFAEESMIYSMHMAEQGSEAMEKEKTYAQIQRINEYIKKLDEALERIKNKSYGVCRVCGCLIAKERLNAVPITTLSASYKIHKKCPDDGIDRIEPVKQ